MKSRDQLRLHFVGIGGIGMSGIAEVLHNQGWKVSGSDLSESEITQRLTRLGVHVSIGHDAKNVKGADVVVISSAVRKDNPEVVEARVARIPVIPRAEMLGELMRGKTGIAVGGTHGKTTTTSMLATILATADRDPTVVVGGRVDLFGGNAKLGQSEYVVAEADESDGSFLHLPATYAVITNIDNDHLDHFGGMERLEQAFVDFVDHIPFYGVAAVCGDDPRVSAALSRMAKPVRTYGFGDQNDVIAKQIHLDGMGSSFDVVSRGRRLGKVILQVPGRHNILNALGATVIALELGLDWDDIVGGLIRFLGVKRRFEVRWKDEQGGRVIIDDYAHHPTEIQATLAAAREYWKGRIVTVFQPHRYSRTQLCHAGFTHAFKDTDLLFVTDIYAAGEEPIPGVTGQGLQEAIRKTGRDARFVHTLDQTAEAVASHSHPGDLILCLGAGSITRLPDLIRARISPGL